MSAAHDIDTAVKAEHDRIIGIIRSQAGEDALCSGHMGDDGYNEKWGAMALATLLIAASPEDAERRDGETWEDTFTRVQEGARGSASAGTGSDDGTHTAGGNAPLTAPVSKAPAPPSALKDALRRVAALAECDICGEGDAMLPIHELRIKMFDGDFRVEWWCHGEEYSGRLIDGKRAYYATDAFISALSFLGETEQR